MVYLSLPPSEAVERVLLRGFKSVELSYDNFLSSRVRELAELSKVADTVSRYNLESFSVHLPYDSLELGVFRLTSFISRLSKWVKVLDRVSVDFYVTHLPHLPPSRDSIDAAVRYLRKLADIVSGSSQILVENIASTGRLGASPEELLAVVRNADIPRLGVCVDVGHAMIARTSLPSFSSILRELIKSVHLHDNDGFSDKHLLPGVGVLDVDKLMEFLAVTKPILVVAEVACRGLSECDSVLNSIADIGLVLKRAT
ncbi:MAG: sugar phosphate isomerase/epimerase family protein [Sulfolobales archaeon]